MEKIRVVELFAGIGGFRLGLEKTSKSYKIVWSNQWEPSTKKQDASEIYTKHFGNESHSNQNISTVDTKDIPDHDLLVGGFPCQDYSVAKPSNYSEGIQGKKGSLWWEIHRIIKGKRTPTILLENVDRLIKYREGKDFTIILESLNELGYTVEWKVINSADYGFPQRRKRVFILAYLNSREEVLSKAFPSEILKTSEKEYLDSGIMKDNKIISYSTKPTYTGERSILRDILLPEVSEEYFIKEGTIERWKYLKGSKDEERNKKGFTYRYKEGSMSFPDPIDKPSRTIITGEGGTAPSRTKHVIEDGGLRRLHPVELERLSGFPDNWTEGLTDTKRAFMIGNALVVGLVEMIGKTLI